MKATLRDLLNLVFRFGRTLLIFWVVASLAIVVYYTQTARKYGSKARILVSLGSANERRADYLERKDIQLMQREQQIHNEQQILLSEHVLMTTAKWILGEPTPGDPSPPLDAQVVEARRFLTGEAEESTPLLRLVKVASKSVERISKAMRPGHRDVMIPESTKLATKLSQGLDAKTIFNSDALDVSFYYRDARVSQTVLKLILAAYMDHHISVFRSDGESDLLKSELDHSVNQYQQQLYDMADFMTKHHVFTEDAQLTSSIQQRQQISQSLGEAAAESVASSARLETFSSLNNSLKRYETYSTVEAHSKLHDELESKLNEAQVQEQQVLNSHPVGSQLNQDQTAMLRRIRELLASQPSKMIDQVEERRSGASQLVEQQLISATSVQKGAQARKGQLANELSDANEAINDLARSLPGYDMIKLNLNLSKEQSEQMAKAYVTSRLRVLTAQNEITDIAVIDAPSWEPEPASPKKSMVAALSVALLLLGSIAVILVCAGLDQTVTDRRTTEAAFRVPLAAVLPMVRAKDDDTPQLLESQTEMEFARIYTLVRHGSQPGLVILLAGSNGGEGLSLVGYELARFLGRHAGSRTALLDCTAHAASIPSCENAPALLSLPSNKGFVKRREDADTNATPAASLADLLTVWRGEFTYIVIASSATQEIYKLVDILPSISATFLVLEAGRTRRATAASTLELLRSYGVQGIQLILNKRVFFIPEWLVRRI